MSPGDPEKRRFTHLDALEAEGIHVLREVAAECRSAALLYSGGKHSAVVLHLAAKARAKERVFSFRDGWGQWDPKSQRPELWSLFNTRVGEREHRRVFPISNWTELDVRQYILREHIDLPEIYFAHLRPVVRRRGLLVPVTELTPPQAGEKVEEVCCRFRTVGDITRSAPVESTAATIADIILETAQSRITGRGATRLDDLASANAMEQRKKAGYF